MKELEETDKSGQAEQTIRSLRLISAGMLVGMLSMTIDDESLRGAGLAIGGLLFIGGFTSPLIERVFREDVER